MCSSGLPPLSDKQSQTLQAAYYNGYFERPRGNTATAIADSLGPSCTKEPGKGQDE
ncbi:helix-turn-helix domain-containing protein [Salinibaculum rarum]|uniref:helix-turn-helix domain-containing protein n=1 Tax=Salinibaculum rarum TaxID=3058903 RepID=UPI00265DA352|nr:helix-turn-helix domain-containing protein [Salinibaculum sp. KK48]